MPAILIAFAATVRPARRPVASARRSLPSTAPEAGTLRRLVDQCRFSKGLHREELSAPLAFRISSLSLADSRGRRKGVLP